MAKQACKHDWLLSSAITVDHKKKKPVCSMVCEKCGSKRYADLGDTYTDDSFSKYIRIEQENSINVSE